MSGESDAEIGWYLRISLQIGNYYSTIQDYEKYFGLRSVHIVDGHNEIINPGEEFTRLLNFLDLDPEPIGFEYNEDKGFYCLEKPLRYCLSEEKGHRNASFNLYEAYPEFKILKTGYSSQMFKLYKHIYSCQTIENCCKVEEKRFDWLKDYFCE